MSTETRTVAMAISVEAAAQQWARQDGAPSGSALVVGSEVAGRLRGGVEWRGGRGAIAVIARPLTLEPAESDLAWLAAGLGSVDALEACGRSARAEWPDLVVDAEDVSSTLVHTSALTLLGPGRVNAAILVARVAADDPAPGLTDALIEGLRTATGLLDEPERLTDAYALTCRTIGRAVNVHLLPHGGCRGVVSGIRADGGIDLTTATGMVEAVNVAQLGAMLDADDPS